MRFWGKKRGSSVNGNWSLLQRCINTEMSLVLQLIVVNHYSSSNGVSSVVQTTSVTVEFQLESTPDLLFRIDPKTWPKIDADSSELVKSLRDKLLLYLKLVMIMPKFWCMKVL
jgi:hypothetical protein